MDSGLYPADVTRTRGSGNWPRRLFAAAAFAVLPLAVLHGLALIALVNTSTVVPVLLGLVIGLGCADVATGIVHWACDTWGDEETAWVGPGLIDAFREHHRHPRAMLAHDWVEVNGEVAVAVLLAFAILTLPPVHAFLLSSPAVYAAALGTLLGGGLANQLHQWAHTQAAPAPVRMLQRSGLILSPRRHARHHQAPYTSGYCISTGWANSLLDAIGFWRLLETGIQRLTGQAPRNTDG